MRTLVLAALLFAPLAQANTQVLFNREGTQATVLLMGMPGDLDPAGLFQSLKAPPEDFQGKWSKRQLLPGEGSIACVFSKVVQNSGTCTLILKAAAGLVQIDRGGGVARLMLTGEQAASLAGLFVVPEASNFIFRSKDGRLQLSVVRSEEGKVEWFVIDWNGRGWI